MRKTKDQPRENAEAIYLERKHGWFWVEPIGQRSIYYGPYARQADADQWRERIDDYAAARDARDAQMSALGFRKTTRRPK